VRSFIVDPAPAESIEDFCRRLSPRLVGSLTLHCESRPVAEELAQEALARAWQRWSTVSTMASPDAWTYRVAFNLAASDRRRRRAERRALDRRPQPLAPPERTAETLAVWAALRALPARQRAAVVLRHYAGFSIRETATALDCAEGTVRSLTSQGVQAIRAALGDGEQLEATEATS
jgi:RNA polymerase sigma-70 factor (ECF subfamily)